MQPVLLGIMLSLPLALCSCDRRGGTTLVNNGKTDYTIVLSNKASPSERHAANELRRFLKAIAGVELPIVTDRDPLPAKMIPLGKSAVLDKLNVSIDFNDLGDEGFTIRTVGPHLIIAGGRLRGTMYGVYSLLEDVLGCRWYTSKVSHVPTKRTITIGDLMITQKPSFEYRDPFYYDAFEADWAARNKANGTYTKLDKRRGGKMLYGTWCHTFYMLVDPKIHFKDHPEYFSLIKGKRRWDLESQLCLTNPEVFRIALQTLSGWIRDKPEANVFSVSANDADGHCECAACAKIDQEEGSCAGTLLRFVNALADEVARQHPRIILDTLAYVHTLKPPKITRPRPNVRVRLCPLEVCQYHSYAQCELQVTKDFMAHLNGWSKITGNLYMWHYVAPYHHLILPFPDLDEITTDVPMYKHMGVKGVMFEGSHWPNSGEWLAELKAYLLAKLSWNANADAKAIIADFLNGYYGKAGQPIGAWLDLLCAEVKRRPRVHGTCGPEVDLMRDRGLGVADINWPTMYCPIMTPAVIAESERLLDEAEKLADTPAILDRVKRVKLSLEYVRVMETVQNAARSGNADARTVARQKLDAYFTKLESFGIQYLELSVPLRKTFDEIAKQLK
ncbi:MAG: DUF4838 domain-containing protein [Verrucomicrobia bacterium]|nr:DUF4838 domain-containing protein [Verrucomicrobiota bacterium]